MTKYEIDVMVFQESHTAGKDQLSHREKLQEFDLLGTTCHHMYGTTVYVRSLLKMPVYALPNVYLIKYDK